MNRYGRIDCEYQGDASKDDIVCKTCEGEIVSVKPWHRESYCPYSHNKIAFKDTRVFPENLHYLSIAEKMMVIREESRHAQGEVKL